MSLFLALLLIVAALLIGLAVGFLVGLGWTLGILRSVPATIPDSETVACAKLDAAIRRFET